MYIHTTGCMTKGKKGKREVKERQVNITDSTKTTDRHIDRKTDRQKDRQTERQIDRETNRETEGEGVR